jgi:hypothetical protein
MDIYRERILQVYDANKEYWLCKKCRREQTARNEEDGKREWEDLTCGLCTVQTIRCNLPCIRINICKNQLTYDRVYERSWYPRELGPVLPAVCEACWVKLCDFYAGLPPRTVMEPKMSHEAILALLARFMPRELCTIVTEYSFQRHYKCPATLWHRANAWEKENMDL